MVSTSSTLMLAVLQEHESSLSKVAGPPNDPHGEN